MTTKKRVAEINMQIKNLVLNLSQLQEDLNETELKDGELIPNIQVQLDGKMIPVRDYVVNRGNKYIDLYLKKADFIHYRNLNVIENLISTKATIILHKEELPVFSGKIRMVSAHNMSFMITVFYTDDIYGNYQLSP